MTSVYKYPLEITDEEIVGGQYRVQVKLPKGAKILSVNKQNDSYMLWALVDTEADFEFRNVLFVGTGWPLNKDFYNYDFIQTHLIYEGVFVYHIFVD